MEDRRLFAIIGGAILTLITGGLTVFWLNDNCPHLSPNNCGLVWIAAGTAVLAGALLAELLIARRQGEGEEEDRIENSPDRDPHSSNWYVWFRPIAWVVLSSLLAGLPLMVQGSFVIALFGTATGLFLVGWIRGIMNRLPTLEKDES